MYNVYAYKRERGNIVDSVSDMKLRIVVDARAQRHDIDQTKPKSRIERKKTHSPSRVNLKSDSIVATAKFNEYRLQSLSASNEVMLQCDDTLISVQYPAREFSVLFESCKHSNPRT